MKLENRIQLSSPYGEYRRGNLEGEAYILLKNGAVGTYKRTLPGGAYLVHWDMLGLEIPMPGHWIKPMYVMEKK